ncbi:MAG: hypothetical protein H6822_24645 [Planctomycetaceae bacterium]|nr:hypothetical protein [Planctomycetales bacterium]MCB9925391.1 hypothetical protein [Planctomycetaceae bacterium]
MADQNQQTSRGLFGKPRDQYGERYDDHLLEQYKLFADSAIRVTEWRNSANNFLLATNTVLVTLFGLASTLNGASPWRCAVAIAGLLVALAWLFLILSYKNLNSTKFKVIHEIEQQLPLALFRHEWDVHTERSDHTRLTINEVFIPIVFALLYVLLLSVSCLGEPTDKPIKLDVKATVTAVPSTTQNGVINP